MTKEELKSKNENLFECNTILLNENERLKRQIGQAKELLIKWVELLTHTRTALDTKTVMQKAEQFLKEIEK